MRLTAAVPDAYKKAQEAVDKVVGRDRMPSLSDMDDLPYIMAVRLAVLWLQRRP